MPKFIKQTGLSAIVLSAMLVLFTGCGDDDDGGVTSLAQLEAKTVNCITTTDKNPYPRSEGAELSGQRSLLAAGEEWCSFDPASQLSTAAGGKVGEALPLYLQENRTDEYRSAEITVDYSGRLFRDPAAVADARLRNSGVRPGVG